MRRTEKQGECSGGPVYCSRKLQVASRSQSQVAGAAVAALSKSTQGKRKKRREQVRNEGRKEGKKERKGADQSGAGEPSTDSHNTNTTTFHITRARTQQSHRRQEWCLACRRPRGKASVPRTDSGFLFCTDSERKAGTGLGPQLSGRKSERASERARAEREERREKPGEKKKGWLAGRLAPLPPPPSPT